jgi:hypothetical protein
MFGDLSHHLLEDSNIMFHSLMIVTNLLGSIFSKISLMYSKNFMIFSSWLSASSTRGFLLLKLTGRQVSKAHVILPVHGHCTSHLMPSNAPAKWLGQAQTPTSTLPLKFWNEAFSTTAYLINRLPSRVIDFASPFGKLFLSKPEYP